MPGPAISWTPPCPPIGADHVLRVQGYPDVSKVRPVIRGTAESVSQRACEIAKPQGCYRRLAITARAPGVIVLEGRFILSCEAFDRLLGDCTETIAFVLTLGPAFDLAVADLITQHSRHLDALLMESAGWLAIEALTRQLGQDLRAELHTERRRLSYRMGPGYSYRTESGRVMWRLEEQHTLFQAFDGAQLPVELMESAAMRPKMSRSGLFGVRLAT